MHKLTIEKENQISNLQADFSSLRHQIELSNKQCNTLSAEMSSLEKRIAAKNDYITSLEEQKHKRSQKIHNLEDEIMSWKFHVCRADGEAVFEQVRGKQAKQAEEASHTKGTDIQKSTEESHNSPDDTNEAVEAADCQREDQQTTNDDPDMHTGNVNKTVHNKSVLSAQKNASTASTKLTVQMVGTSNIKFISQEYIGESDFSVSKITRYTLEETYDYVEKLTPTDRHDGFILHSLCNETGIKTPAECSNYIKRIIDNITQKYSNTKIIISLGLPRSEASLNRCIEKTNILIKEKISHMKNVYTCDNSNLFYRGDAQKGILHEDGLHLARNGTRKLGENMKETLWDAFDIPIFVSYEPKRDGGESRRGGNNKIQDGEQRWKSHDKDTADRESWSHNNKYSRDGESQSQVNNITIGRKNQSQNNNWDRERRSHGTGTMTYRKDRDGHLIRTHGTDRGGLRLVITLMVETGSHSIISTDGGWRGGGREREAVTKYLQHTGH